MTIRKNLLFLALVLFLPVSAVFAQDAAEQGDFWMCPGTEIAFYSPVGPANGGGLALGYGRGTSIGVKAMYLLDTEGLSTLELSFLLRCYILKSMHYSGPFVQFTAGPVLFAPDNGSIALPAKFGVISAGLYAGWRFLLGNTWFVEPSIRAGYPYIVGAGVSAGFHFSPIKYPLVKP